MKPNLFLPLKSEHFDRFDDGSKDTERRVYGKKWNTTVCHVGRKVTLSRGYGKKKRLVGVITNVHLTDFQFLTPKTQEDLIACYGNGVVRETIIEITIHIDRFAK